MLMRYDVVNRILEKIGSQRYLEIGVFDGETMRRVCATVRVGVDPAPQRAAVAAATEFHALPSDAYFVAHPAETFDVAFIDGLHHADQAYRDITSACRCSRVVVVHDSSPSTEAMQIVPPIQGEWTGDVWKAVARIRAEGRHAVRTIDTDYGVAVVLPNRGEVVSHLPRETWSDLMVHRTELLGLIAPEEWEIWFDAAYLEVKTIILGVPVLSRYDLLERFIASAEDGTLKPDRYLVVDNGGKFTETPSVRRALERGATVSVLSTGGNLGVAASWNAILREAHPESVVISNDDITLGPETLARLYGEDGASKHEFVIAEGPLHAKGWCLYAQTQSLTAKVGFYDENFYPAYYEDTDFHRRMTLAGVEPYRLPTDHTHEGWATIKQEGHRGPTYLGQQKCLEYYTRKWGGAPGQERYTEPFDGAYFSSSVESPREYVWVDLKLAEVKSVALSGPLMRYDVVNRVLEKLGSDRYLEIGVSDGETMRRVKAEYRVGVDPVPQAGAVSAATEFFPITSDEFFARGDAVGKFGVTFVDGWTVALYASDLHHADQAYRDIENACRVSDVVVVHDASPSTEAMQVVPYRGGDWTGDVWKAVSRIRDEGQHAVRTIDTDFGVAVVLPDRGESVPEWSRATWTDLVSRRAELLGLLSSGAWEEWFDMANRRERRAARSIEKKKIEIQQGRICLNMIVKNEGAIIERCLTAALPFIDKWVITDTGSTDGTGDAIRQFFVEHPLPGKLALGTFKNFAQARNDSLEAARAFGGWDYALLIDADMVIRGLIDKKSLTAPAYRLQQFTGTLGYWNTRLIRRDVAANYVGVTHEFLSVPGDQPPNLDSLFIDDRNDGGSKGDKGERDIRLLSGGLAKEPNNERYLFYLAQTYREMGRHHEAIQRYTQRIAAGGWDEEVWASYYGIARSYAALNDEPNLVLACFDAYNYRPIRAESLSLLARWWREHGKNDAALLIAEQVARMPLPNEVLFVERDIYERKNENDVAISGFYSKLPERRKAGYDTCAKLTIDRDGNVRGEARGNFVHYAKNVTELFGAEVREIDWKPTDGYAPMNPSVLVLPSVDGPRRLCLVRTVNYKVADGQYPTIDGSGIIRTKNWIVELDEAWRTTGAALVVDRTGLPRTSYSVEGYEDCRLYSSRDGGIAASATVRDLGDGRCEMAILSLEEARRPARGWVVTGARVIRDYEHDRAQKNWMPVLGQPDRFLYLCDPTTVIDCAPEGTVVRSRINDLDQNLTEFRGGSQVIPHEDGFLCLVHEVVFTPERVYLHRFVRLTEKLEIRSVSEPFYFLQKGIEFAAGLARDGDRLVASFGVNDASAHLAFFSVDAVDRLL